MSKIMKMQHTEEKSPVEAMVETTAQAMTSLCLSLRQLLDAQKQSIYTPDFSKAERLAHLKQKETLTPPEVQELYGIYAGTLAVMRANGYGPEYHKPSKGILYTHKQIKDFMEKNKIIVRESKY